MSYNQTDFVKERVAVEVQFGKYAFVAHDLFVKHLSFYKPGRMYVYELGHMTYPHYIVNFPTSLTSST